MHKVGSFCLDISFRYCISWNTTKQNPEATPQFTDLGHGVSLHGCSSKAQPLLLTLDEGYLLTTTIPDIRRGSLRRNGVAIMGNKRVRNAVLGCNLKNDRMISVHLHGKSFKITVIQVYAPTSNAEETEGEWIYEDLQDL